MKYRVLFSGRKYENIINLSSAELAQKHRPVNVMILKCASKPRASVCAYVCLLFRAHHENTPI